MPSYVLQRRDFVNGGRTLRDLFYELDLPWLLHPYIARTTISCIINIHHIIPYQYSIVMDNQGHTHIYISFLRLSYYCNHPDMLIWDPKWSQATIHCFLTESLVLPQEMVGFSSNHPEKVPNISRGFPIGCPMIIPNMIPMSSLW